VLQVQSAATALGEIEGVVGGDAFSVTGTSLTGVTIGASSLDIETNSGAFDFANVLYGGAITGYVAFADPVTTGMERVLLTDGVAANLQETDKTIYENDSGANITGAGNTIDFLGSAASIASIYSTGAEADKGDDGIVYLDGSQANVFGSADTVHFESGYTGEQVELAGALGVWDVVEGSSGVVTLESTWAKVEGGGDNIAFASASGNEADLFDTVGVADSISGSNGTVFFNSSQASITGGGDTVDFNSGTGNIATLKGTGSTADVIRGVTAGTVDLDGATASVSNNGDAFAFSGANVLDLIGTAETMAFAQGIGGLDSIAGVVSSDIFQFSSADFANFAALQAHMTQSGANTVISLGASDAVTLENVAESSLTAGQFKFA
jgi:hypothetical protein